MFNFVATLAKWKTDNLVQSNFQGKLFEYAATRDYCYIGTYYVYGNVE